MIRKYKNKTPKIGDNVYISESAMVIGDVTLGNSVNIWFGSVLRGDMHYIKIGDRTNIQDNSVVQNNSPNGIDEFHHSTRLSGSSLNETQNNQSDMDQYFQVISNELPSTLNKPKENNHVIPETINGELPF